MARLKTHDYQTETIEKVLAEPTRAALIGEGVGRGKTLCATEIVLAGGWKRVLFIGIAETFDQWKATIEGQSAGAASIRRLDSTKAGKQVYADFLAGEDGFFFATIHWLMRQDFAYRDKLDFEGNPIEKIDKKTGMLTGKFEREKVHLKTFDKMCRRKRGGLDAVVFDEAHAVSNRKSTGRTTLLSFRGRLLEDGEHEQMWKIALSATWAGNSFENAWSLTRWLWPTLIPAFWNWHDEWCEVEKVYIPGRSDPVPRVVGEKEPGAFVKTLPCYVANGATEEAPEATVIHVDPTPQQEAQMQDLKRDLMTWVETDGGEHPLVVDVPGALYARFKQLALAELTIGADGESVEFAPGAASAKLRALKGILDHWGAQPVVLLTDSKLFANLATDRMRAAGYNAVAWTGDVPRKERERIKQAFIAGEYQYLVGTVQAMGTGLDGLQAVCSKIVWLNKPDGDPKLEIQARGRILRQGMTKKYGEFEEVVLVQNESHDTKILETLLAKAETLRASIGKEALAA
ncbi:helicase-related protein [Microbacterium sp.]|uniref:helicase-related protein n=1 Tax=Microbacterium sp. TaxID=51671 RepID=UPI0039E3AF8A